MEDPPKVKIERPIIEHQQLRQDYDYQKTHPSHLKKFFSSCKECDPVSALKRTVPVLEWLPKYKWKTDFSSDFISGCTVAIMHISQGMAYSMLGNVPPVIGIYMAFFPVLMYFLLGTSRHNSMGTFAVVCLMTGKVVLEHNDQYTPTQIAQAVTFVVAIVQLVMYIFRLGVASTLLSETLVSGFTTGAALHVFTSQLKDIFGFSMPKSKGNFININTLRNIFANIDTMNYVAVIISAITITASIFCNEILKPRVAKYTRIPVPMELIAVVIGTVVSTTVGLNEHYGVKIIGNVPSGLPQPTLPPFELISAIWVDCIMIAIVSYTISLSMGLIFAQKQNYELDANQELLAKGMGNLVGSFFSCMPFTASLSRSSIQESVGGKTQMVSMVSCGLLVVVLIWIGPYFEPLPKSVLASIIVVALKSLLFQVKDFFKFLSLSKMDAAVWMVTFLVVVIVQIDIGLLAGILMSLLSIFVLGFKPYTCLLGWVPQTDLYLDINRYKGVKEFFDVKIFHYQGSINFASKNLFKSELYKAIEIYPQQELAARKKLEKLTQSTEHLTNDALKFRKEKLNSINLKCIVLDFSALSYIDPSGVTMLKLLSQEFQRIDIPIFIGGCSEPVYEVMCKCDLIGEKENYYKIFPTLHDAVQQATTSLSLFNISISRL